MPIMFENNLHLDVKLIIIKSYGDKKDLLSQNKSRIIPD